MQKVCGQNNWKKENIQARLESLQYQISPHFLFNNFNTLYGLIKENPDLARDYLLRLSTIYRNVLQHKHQEVIALEEELKALKAYLFLIKTRYQDDVKINMEINQNGEMYFLPPLSLQMLVENAIKHNAFDEDNPLQISLVQKKDYIQVLNNYHPNQKHNDSLGIGLDNIKKRYELLADRQIKVKETKAYFSVEVPLLQIVNE